jgi:hypothetical protein
LWLPILTNLCGWLFTAWRRKGSRECPSSKEKRANFLGMVSLDDLLKARARHLEEERRRERTLRLTFLIPGGRIPKNPAPLG